MILVVVIGTRKVEQIMVLFILMTKLELQNQSVTTYIVEKNEGTPRNIQEDENIEGAPRNIQAEGKTEMLDHTPIYIGGGLAVFILIIGFCLGVTIVRHPHSYILNWMGNLIK